MQSSAAVQSNTEPSRQAVVNDYQRPESLMLLHKGCEGEATLAISCGGKNYRFRVNRRQGMLVTSQFFEWIADLEPHTPAGWP